MRRSIRFVFFLSIAFLSACASDTREPVPQAPERSAIRVEATANPSPDARLAVAQKRSTGPDRVAVSSSARVYGATRVTGDFAGYASVEQFLDRLVREEGFDADQLAGVLSRVERKQWIVDFVNRPKRKGPTGPTGAWTRYRAKFLTASNISGGVKFWRRYESVLERAQARYGVPPEYVVAILGVETRYGGYMGKHRVIDALATLAFDFPRRSEFFTGELAAFLIMARDEGFDPFAPVGSYAGAMGLGQFMPSSFHHWAVDFDGDGRRDLWNRVDAIGSVANYFAAHGWRAGEPVIARARVDGPVAGTMKTGYDSSYTLETLGRNGVHPKASLSGAESVSLIRLDASGGYQYWLGLPNFYVITRYNHSSYYAMAVHQLAESVRARYGVPTGTRLSQAGAGQ